MGAGEQTLHQTLMFVLRASECEESAGYLGSLGGSGRSFSALFFAYKENV
jgi:hypothetical protein